MYLIITISTKQHASGAFVGDLDDLHPIRQLADAVGTLKARASGFLGTKSVSTDSMQHSFFEMWESKQAYDAWASQHDADIQTLREAINAHNIANGIGSMTTAAEL